MGLDKIVGLSYQGSSCGKSLLPSANNKKNELLKEADKKASLDNEIVHYVGDK